MQRSRVACDSLVALAGATADGSVLFAKNSDRPADECQPLTREPRRTHAPGSSRRCTYIEIPQVVETAGLIGSRPYWCWGFEHGLNEHGVAVGNHTVFTKDSLCGLGLIGMDLVRLGLERSRTAGEALRVMTALIEHHGQGGSGYADKDWPYHNSFLIADRETAFVLETSDRQWAARRVRDVASVSNHLGITDDWDTLSTGAVKHAVAAGWWSADADRRFDFAAAYRDVSVVPEVVSSGRHQRTCTVLRQAHGHLTAGTLRQALRDHYGTALPPRDATPAEARYFSVCMHAEPVGTTTASLVAHLPPSPGTPPTYWASLGSPCVSAFIPLYLDAEIPGALTRGGAAPSGDSAWWLSKRLLTLVARDWERHAAPVRVQLDAFETAIATRAAEAACGSLADRTAFMQASTDALLALLRRLCAALEQT